MTENNRLIPIIDEYGNLNGTLLMINTNFDVHLNFDINDKENNCYNLRYENISNRFKFFDKIKFQNLTNKTRSYSI